MKLGAGQKKILLVLMTDAAVMLSYSSKQQYHVIRLAGKEWRKINRQTLSRSLQALRNKKLVEWKKEGKYLKVVLTRSGRKHAEIYRMDEMKLTRPRQWDGKWRVVLFDVPEKEKMTRDYFRRQLKRLNFFELQKSVFLTPYDCRRKMQKISASFQGGRAIRYLEATYVDNQEALRKHFNLT